MSFHIQDLIYTVRGVQVMLDSDLAVLYGVETKVFNQAVKRNLERFPLEFRFQLTQDEFDDLRSQIATSSAPLLRSQTVTLNSDDLRGKHRKYLPYAFTEQGVAMLSAVIKSGTAVVFAGFWHSTSSFLSQESFTNTRTAGASIALGDFA